MRLTVGSGTLSLPNLTDLDTSNLFVQGRELTLPNLTTYNNPNSFDNTQIESTGGGQHDGSAGPDFVGRHR